MTKLWRGYEFGGYTSDELDDLLKNPASAVRQFIDTRQMGIHWTDNPTSAENFALGRGPDGWAHDAGFGEEIMDYTVGVILEASVDNQHILEEGSEEWEAYSFTDAIFDSSHPEAEVTVRGDAPITITGAELLWSSNTGENPGGYKKVPMSMRVKAAKVDWDDGYGWMVRSPDPFYIEIHVTDDATGTIAGRLQAELSDDESSFVVTHIKVHPDYRRKGLGTEMWEEARGLAERKWNKTLLHDDDRSADALAWIQSLPADQRRHASTLNGNPDFDFVVKDLGFGEWAIKAVDGDRVAGEIEIGITDKSALVVGLLVYERYRGSGNILGTRLWEEAKGFAASKGVKLYHDTLLSDDAMGWIRSLPAHDQYMDDYGDIIPVFGKLGSSGVIITDETETLRGLTTTHVAVAWAPAMGGRLYAAIGAITYDPPDRIELIAVKERHQGQGIARKLLEFARKDGPLNYTDGDLSPAGQSAAEAMGIEIGHTRPYGERAALAQAAQIFMGVGSTRMPEEMAHLGSKEALMQWTLNGQPLTFEVAMEKAVAEGYATWSEVPNQDEKLALMKFKESIRQWVLSNAGRFDISITNSPRPNPAVHPEGYFPPGERPGSFDEAMPYERNLPEDFDFARAASLSPRLAARMRDVLGR